MFFFFFFNNVAILGGKYKNFVSFQLENNRVVLPSAAHILKFERYRED